MNQEIMDMMESEHEGKNVDEDDKQIQQTKSEKLNINGCS